MGRTPLDVKKSSPGIRRDVAPGVVVGERTGDKVCPAEIIPLLLARLVTSKDDVDFPILEEKPDPGWYACCCDVAGGVSGGNACVDVKSSVFPRRRVGVSEESVRGEFDAVPPADAEAAFGFALMLAASFKASASF